MAKKVLLGMSGGVDSSVSAILLKKQGYEVIGATMLLWKDSKCSTNQAIQDAKKVCEKLEIPHVTIDCQKEFKEHVIDNFINNYENAKTPNPCIECNQYLKFGAFYEKAKELNCEYIATGHYAKAEWNDEAKQYALKKANAEKKDQSYFLYRMPKEVLPHVLFPLQEFHDKSEIRKIAEEYNLPVAKKKDSQEVCFIPDNCYGKFLEENSLQKPKKGNFVLKNGTIVGEHEGLPYYTVGQRKGMGISYHEPLYVLQLDAKKNEVIVGSEKELYQIELYANELNFLVEFDDNQPIKVMAKVRYRAVPAKAIVTLQDNGKIAKVIFEEPQRAITPGQSVVFYQEDMVIGGGKITK